MSETAAILTIGLLCAVPSAILAARLEARRRAFGAIGRSFLWGYFQALQFILVPLAMILVFIAVSLNDAYFDLADFGGLVLILSIWIIPGVFVLRRRRWAWVALTILELNPISWVINGLYGEKRWTEFDLPVDEWGAPPQAAMEREAVSMYPESEAAENVRSSASSYSDTSAQDPPVGLSDRIAVLERLAALFRDGYLSEAEFRAEKRRILGADQRDPPAT